MNFKSKFLIGSKALFYVNLNEIIKNFQLNQIN
jgi:hypothetical protein